MTSNSEKYLAILGLSPSSHQENKTKIETAFTTAPDTRKFEIQLYWQRAAYFWAFTAAALTGFVAIQAITELKVTDALSLLIATVGLFTATAWHQVNKGSKAWQENWENHVDFLQGYVVGELFEKVLMQQSIQLFSVSRINNHISRSMIFFWFALILAFGPSVWEQATLSKRAGLYTEVALANISPHKPELNIAKPPVSISVKSPSVSVKFEEAYEQNTKLNDTAVVITIAGLLWSALLWSGCLGVSSQGTQARRLNLEKLKEPKRRLSFLQKLLSHIYLKRKFWSICKFTFTITIIAVSMLGMFYIRS
ncbi:hypothetical protein [Pseudovibrio sp. Ad37]|uniref:RipA family octameric membrane protein n=1 Tax=Pseudovibrio sp. Ad37 TaxID=989422 RepID=UPI0007AE3AD9|nr:hypothetical protein [Pseudovibrio sp. Ad37]KZL14436.1 hypothetical protein PsAD37_05067 [Pseudovibrio sp. Ad37]